MSTNVTQSNLTSLAVSATLHCLTGCAIGEVLGMVIGTALGWSDLATIALAVALAFVFGYSLTIRPVLRSGLPLRQAIGVALAADTVSIAVMEVVDNAVMVAVPGAMEAGLNSWLFWLSLAFALAVAFVVTVPVNRWMIARGRGHAVVHQYHHGGHTDHSGHTAHADHGGHTAHADHGGHTAHADHGGHAAHADDTAHAAHAGTAAAGPAASAGPSGHDGHGDHAGHTWHESPR